MSVAEEKKSVEDLPEGEELPVENENVEPEIIDEEKVEEEFEIADMEENVENLDDASEVEEFASGIIVKVTSITGLPVLFTAADFCIVAKFQNKVIATSQPTPLTDQESMPCDFIFEIPVDGNNPISLDTLCSSPLHFTVTETAGTYDLEIYPPHGQQDTFYEGDTLPSIECEEILGVLPEEPEPEEPIPKKGKKGSVKEKSKKIKSETKSKSSKDSTKSKKSISEKKTSRQSTKTSKSGERSRGDRSRGDAKSVEASVEPAPKVVGVCSMSLMPFLEGELKLDEELVLQQPAIVDDDRLVTYIDLPRMKVSIELNGQKLLPSELPPNIMSFTIESIYNPPAMFNENMKYVAGTYLPVNSKSGSEKKVKTVQYAHLVELTPLKFDQGNFVSSAPPTTVYKKWFNLLGQDENGSIYTGETVPLSAQGVRNNVPNLNLQSNMEAERPRVDWNFIRQCCLKPVELENVVKYHIIRQRCWPLEFYFTPSTPPPGKSRSAKDDRSSKGSKEGSQKGRGSTREKGKKPLAGPLHLMAFVDTTRLLCPGETKTRVACEIRTFNFDDLKDETGWQDSIFVPKPKPPTPESQGNLSSPEGKKDSSEGKKPRGSKDGGKAKSTKDKSSTATDKNAKKDSLKKKSKLSEDFKEPSVPLVDEEGNPTFVIIEISFSRPIFPKRAMEDLSDEITKLLPTREEISPFVINKQLARRKMEDCFKTIISKLYSEYKKYQQQDPNSSAATGVPFQGSHLFNFVEYIQESGAYQVCLMTLIKDALLYVQQYFDISSVIDEDTTTTSDYEVLMSNVYVHLVRFVNKILNGPLTCGLSAKLFNPPDYTLSDCWRRVCEADELGAKSLALRYVNELVAAKPRDPDAWLLRAVYHQSHGDCDRANECIKECLALKLDHEYGLLLYAIQFFERDDMRAAETTFLTLIAYYPSSLAGWVCLLAFYAGRVGDRIAAAACELCSDRIVALKKPTTPTEENEKQWPEGGRDELAWTVSDVRPEGDKHLAVASLLLRLRALKYAEMVMGLVPGIASVDPAATQGERCYYTAVSHYLRRDYEEALVHLKEAVRYKGHDHNIGALEGHCLFQMGQHERACELYECALRLFAQPKIAHLIHVRLAISYDKMGRPADDVKKCLLYVCSRLPTPYDWLLLGACYYKESSWTLAEDCLSEANLLDRGIPDTWAYLTLINIRIGRPWIASQCYQQMLKHDLQTEWLLKLVENEISKLEGGNEHTLHSNF